MNDNPTEVAEAHWSYISELLRHEHPEGIPLEYISKIKFHYISAFIHGWKHGWKHGHKIAKESNKESNNAIHYIMESKR